MSDPLSITLSAIPLVALAAQAGQSTCNAYNDFRNAERSMRHIQGQLEFLHANLENTAALSNIKLAAAKRSFEAIEEDSNGLRMRSTKRGRLSWAMGGQKEADSLITQYKNTELSASYAIQLETSSVLEQTRLA
jgi:hypothetical protein